MAYLVEKDWITKAGLRAVVISFRHHRCGYVGISGEHPLYEIKYSDPTHLFHLKDAEEATIGKKSAILALTTSVRAFEGESIRRSPDIIFDVHGGLTYSGGGYKSDYPVKSDLWWFGFDCTHLDVSQSLDYMIEECERLAKQIVEYPYYT